MNLRSRVRIERHVTGQDSTGQPNAAWTTVADVWADVKYASGLAAILADADKSIAKVSIRIRYRDDLTANMRLTLAGTQYNIQALLPDQRKRYIDLVCEVIK